MIFLHLWKEMAFSLGLSVDDLEILLAFQEKGPRYSKDTYNIIYIIDILTIYINIKYT